MSRVLSIQRDFGPNVNLVRIVTDDSPENVQATGWLGFADIAQSIIDVNNGPFEWQTSDLVLVHFFNAATNNFFASASMYAIFPSFKSLNPLPLIFPTLNNVVAHPGGGQANASPLNIGSNIIQLVATAGDSVVLPSNVLGQIVIVYNNTNNAAAVFPSLGDQINDLPADASLSLPGKSSLIFWGVGTNTWATSSSISPIYPSTQGITAHAGGGQANATQLNYGVNVVTTVATTNDSVKLPANVLGQTVLVLNNTTNDMQVFPSSGGSIDSGATDAASLQKAGLPSPPADKSNFLVYYGMTTTNWRTVGSV